MLKKHNFKIGDLWDGPKVLANCIYPFLVKFRKQFDKQKSIGFRCLRDHYEVSQLPKKESDKHDKECYNLWLSDLDKMIFSFEHYYKGKDLSGPAMDEYWKERTKFLKGHRKELQML